MGYTARKIKKMKGLRFALKANDFSKNTDFTKIPMYDI